MGEQQDYTAKVNSKGLQGTGFTEQVAARYFNTVGSEVMAVVRLRAVKVITDDAGKHTVQFAIVGAEPAQTTRMEDHLRDVERALYRQRPEVIGQETLKGVTSGPNADQVVADGEALLVRDDDGTVSGVWDGSMDDEDTAEEEGEGDEPDRPGNVVQFSG